MLTYLTQLAERYPDLSFLRLFGYVTFRAAGAACTAFFLALVFGPLTVKLLHHFQAVAPHRTDGLVVDDPPEPGKNKTPSMGGLLLLFATLVAIVLWCNPTSALVLIFLGLMISLGVLGFLDDYLKIANQSRDGLSSRSKLFWQVLIAVAAVILLDSVPETGDNVRQLMVPFFKYPVIENMALWMTVLFGVIVLVGASNAVNLTDGMDGLAIGCTITCALTYAVFAYMCGHFFIAEHLRIPFVPGSSEVSVIAFAMAGAGLGFLWHNCYPASMFMGDTGSLSLGGAIGLIAVLVKQELVLVLVGGVFVLEAGSVILQVSYFKLTRRFTGTPRRIFLCAPYHHHLKLGGWKETQIVVRFWILSLVLAGLGLATLKIR